MSKQQIKPGARDDANKQEEKPGSRARRAATEGPTEDPRVDRINRARARAGKASKGRPEHGGKGRDARALREQQGANARRGNTAPKDEEEEQEEEEEADDLFWKDMVDGAYRSRKRRGDWDDPHGLH